MKLALKTFTTGCFKLKLKKNGDFNSNIVYFEKVDSENLVLNNVIGMRRPLLCMFIDLRVIKNISLTQSHRCIGYCS